MTHIKLTYFDFPGGRGEDARIALFMAGVDFEDDRIAPSDWMKVKPKTPWGSLPVLEVEGLGRIGQSNAILAYIGRRWDMHPDDLWAAARHEAIMHAVEDVRHEIGKTFGIDDADALREARATIADDFLPRWAAHMEAQLGDGPFIDGDDVHVADLKLFVLMSWFDKGVLDHIPTDVLSDFPRLTTHFDAMGRHPKVVEWYADE